MKSLRFLLTNYPSGDSVAAEVRITDALISRLIDAYKYASESGNSVLVATMANILYLDDDDEVDDIEVCDEPKLNPYVVEFEVTPHLWGIFYFDEEGRIYMSRKFYRHQIVSDDDLKNL